MEPAMRVTIPSHEGYWVPHRGHDEHWVKCPLANGPRLPLLTIRGPFAPPPPNVRNVPPVQGTLTITPIAYEKSRSGTDGRDRWRGSGTHMRPTAAKFGCGAGASCGLFAAVRRKRAAKNLDQALTQAIRADADVVGHAHEVDYTTWVRTAADTIDPD